MMNIQSMISMIIAKLTKRHFSATFEAIDEAVNEAYGIGELEAEFDDAVAIHLTKEVDTAQMASGNFKDSSLLKPSALFTQQQVKKTLKELKRVEELKKIVQEMMKTSPRKVLTEYLTNEVVCACVDCSPNACLI